VVAAADVAAAAADVVVADVAAGAAGVDEINSMRKHK
jgi:hypothetical protein